MTSTVALSFFGVVGTVVGAALGSAITVVGNDLYSRSIRRTTERVVQYTPVLTQPRGLGPRGTSGGDARAEATLPVPNPPGDDESTRVLGDDDPDESAVQDEQTRRLEEPSEPGALDPEAAEAKSGGLWARLTAKYGRTKILIASGIVVFLTILAAVLLVELATGKPLSDTVRGRDGSGTTLFDIGGSTSVEDDDPEEAPAPDDDPARPPTEDEAPGENGDDDAPLEDDTQEDLPQRDEEAPSEPDDEGEPADPEEQIPPGPGEPQPEPEEFDEPPSDPDSDVGTGLGEEPSAAQG